MATRKYPQKNIRGKPYKRIAVYSRKGEAKSQVQDINRAGKAKAVVSPIKIFGVFVRKIKGKKGK